MFLLINVTSAYGQQPQLASYRETANILVDQKFQNLTTAFITLSTTSPLEMRVPAELDQKIHQNPSVSAVVVTNAQSCFQRIIDRTCVIVNITNQSLIETYDIKLIQSSAQAIGDRLIGDINKAFGLNAKPWEVFVNPKGSLNTALGTSGAISGNRTVSVLYVMPRSDSGYFLEGLVPILLPQKISTSGGFLDTATKMANVKDVNSSVTFAITPKGDKSLYSLQVKRHFPIKGQITTINPLDLFGVDKLDRSSYFNAGFFPLNSLLEVTILSNHPAAIIDHGGNLVPVTENKGQKIPADLTKAGCLFDPSSGNQITAIYLFGTTFSASKNDLTLTIGNTTAGVENPIQLATPTPPKPAITDYTSYVLVGIVAAAGIAIYIFLRKR